MRSIIAIYFTLILTGCVAEHQLRIGQGEVIHIVLKPTINVASVGYHKENIIPGTTKYDQFRSWVENNRGGWKSTPASYTQGEVVVRGQGYSFNFLNEAVVLNYEERPGRYNQLIKVIDSNSYYFLLQK